MLNPFLRDCLCGNICSYFKPWKDEEIACEGFLVVERLVREGKSLPFEQFGLPTDAAMQERLSRNLCSVCAFNEDGCDFIARRRDPSGANDGKSPLPCGGFLFLAYLLERHVIEIDGRGRIV